MQKNKERMVGSIYSLRRVMHSFSWTEIAQEIATLRKEAQAFKTVRTALRSNTQKVVAAKIVFQKVLPLPISLEIFRLIVLTTKGVQC
jgi:hypothetical protein